jgi:transcription antitermination factor NusG
MKNEEKKKIWYAVYTKPRWEKKVDALLKENGVESYCPLNRVRKKWSDRMKWVDEPLFKSYVFVRVFPQDQTRVRMVDGVLNYVYWLGKPAVIKDAEIEDIRRFLGEHSDVELVPMDIKPDDRVVIRSGILMDKTAVVQRVMQHTVEVVIESLGYKLVAKVDRSKVAPITPTIP